MRKTAANAIAIVHLLLVLTIVLAPFVAPVCLLPPYLVLSLGLQVHWLKNGDECGLTRLEAHLRGVPVTGGFCYRLLAPLLTSPRPDTERLVGIAMWVVAISCTVYAFARIYWEVSNKGCLERAAPTTRVKSAWPTPILSAQGATQRSGHACTSSDSSHALRRR